jgi:CRISPR-associated protein Csd1
MILQALCGYYARLAAEGAVALQGWAVTPVTACLTLDADGGVTNVLSLVQDKKPLQMLVPQQPKRAAGVCPAFLCDNAGYFLGFDEKRGTEKRTAARDLHDKILAELDDPGAVAVVRFFARDIPEEIAEIPSGNLVFRLEGEDDYVHNRPALRQAWERYKAAQSTDAERAQCLVTGEQDAPIARLHTNFGGFGQDKPTLVGFNQPSFKSYNLTRGKNNGTNASVSETAMFQYTTALNMLLADTRHRVQMADTKVLFWAEREAEEEESLFGILLGGKEPENDENSARHLKGLLASFRTGKPPSEELFLRKDVRFHILGVSAAKTRLVIRFFYADTFGNLLERIGQHTRDIEIVGERDDKKLTRPFDILLETAVGKDFSKKRDNIPPLLEGALLRCILDGSPYPYSLYNAILTRIRADKKIDHVRAGVLKGFLNRNARRDKQKEMMTVALNLAEKNQGYLLGRLFAVLEKAQYDALGKVNATIVDKYLNSALATPQMVFNVLLPLFEKHVSKSEKYFTKKTVQEILDEFPSSGFPQVLNAEDQGKFLIGYYHQKQSFFAKKEQPTTEETENG